MNLQSLLVAWMAVGAEWVLWLLAAASVTGLAIVIERLVLLIGSKDDLGRLEQLLEQSLTTGERDKARSKLEQSSSLEARVAAAALSTSDPDVAKARAARETALGRAEFERHVGFLGTLGSNAPFVGLLGTVIGIMGAFRELGHDVGRVSEGLMSQIGEALVATAVGLLVAIPAILAYNGFQAAIRLRVERAEVLAGIVLSHLTKRER